MSSTAFADAVRPAEVRVLRCPLLPYTLGHELLLIHQRNPLVTLDAKELSELTEPQRNRALIEAVLICSRPASEHDQPHRWMRVWEWLNRDADYSSALVLFQRYRYEGSSYPAPPQKEADEVANGKESGRQLGGDLLARLTNYLAPLANAFGFSTVWDFPLGAGFHIYFTDLEMDGRMRIENDKERQIHAELNAHYEAIEKERADAIAKAQVEEKPCQH